MTSHRVWMLILSHNSDKTTTTQTTSTTQLLSGDRTPHHTPCCPTPLCHFVLSREGGGLVNSVHGSQRVTVGSLLGIQA